MQLTYPSISVIIPTYNGERFIFETLSSILEQSQQPDEIIVSDDGSSDSTVALVESLVDKTEQSRGANLKLLLSLLKDKHLPNRLLTAEETVRRAETLQDYLAFCSRT